MLTTKQVRAIIRKHIPNAGSWYDPIWTNKLKNPALRTVKCYNTAANSTALIAELHQLAGEENVRLTPNAPWARAGGIIVTCRLA
jgi:hypothetical protein